MLTYIQANKLARIEETMVYIAKVLLGNARKKSMSCMATSSWHSSSTTSCVVHFAANCSNTLLACNVQTVIICVMRSAIRLLSPSVSANRMRKAIQMKQRLITVFRIVSKHLAMWLPTGVVIVAICYP